MPTATWTALVTDVYTLTNRPDLVGDTVIALKLALKAAHRQNKFWRDLTTVTVSGLAVAAVQEIDLAAECPRFRQLGYLKIPGSDYSSDQYLVEAEARDLLDDWKVPKTNVYWGLGDTLNLRATTPVDTYELAYYRQAVTDPETISADWLLTDYAEVPTLLAASTVLANIGEQEIKSRVDQLLALAISNLISDQVEVTGR